MNFNLKNKKALATVIAVIGSGLAAQYPDNAALIGIVSTMLLGALGIENKDKKPAEVQLDNWRDEAKSKAERLESL